MKATWRVLTLMAVGTPPMVAQSQGDSVLQGDSVRLRVPPSRQWTYGRFVALGDERLTISHADSSQSYSLQTVGRFEVRRRKNAAVTLISSTLACMAGAGLAILTRPADRKSIFGSDGAELAVAAGFGLTLGAIDLGISRWRWSRVRLGVKAAT